MKSKKVIIDTGPLVAFLNKHDTHHDWAYSQFSLLTPPFITCEAVLSEACFLLRNFQYGPKNILELVDRGLIILPFNLELESKAMIQLLDKYKNIPMSLADGCLVRLSEQISDSIICTLDIDFKIYKRNKREIIPLIIPDTL
jgi:uncharacterized protein